MTDMGKPIYRTFDPSKETGAEPPEKHRRSLRDRIMRGGDAAAPAPAPSPSGVRGRVEKRAHQPLVPSPAARVCPIRGGIAWAESLEKESARASKVHFHDTNVYNVTILLSFFYTCFFSGKMPIECRKHVYLLINCIFPNIMVGFFINIIFRGGAN